MKQVTLIPGDGIGPSITEATQKVVQATGAAIEWLPASAGQTAYENEGNPLPPATVESIRNTRVALKGPTATPVGLGFRSINVGLRKEFELFANVRPAKAFPGVDCLFPGLDLVVVRENIEGLYSSMEHWVGEGHETAIGIGVNTRAGMERVSRFAFEYAIANGRRKVTAVHKANILKVLSGLFLNTARDVAKEYPQIEFEDRIVDAMAMSMVRDPYQFDVIVTTNLFGDILSDLAAGLIGGLGLAPGANVGHDAAIFEAVHGSAPDIAGKDIANPCSLILAAAMMLRHMEMPTEGGKIERAVRAVLEDGSNVTRDLNPDAGVGTQAMADAIVEHIRNA